MIVRKCFCCEKELTHAGFGPEDSMSNPPNNATYWQTPGNYGSSVFDGGDFTGERLEIFICDACLLKKSNLVYHYRVLSKKEQVGNLTVTKYYEDWRPFNVP